MDRKICVVSGGRADYGLLKSPMAAIRETEGLALQLIVTGQHLSAATDRVIEADGFIIDRRIDIQLGDDSPAGVTRAMGRALIGFADALHDLSPDMLLLLGDRYEILAAAQAALLARIPVAHIAGGDVTEGALDDSIRHALTKLSHVHFVTNEDAGQRVIQMGEDPSMVHVVGSPGLDEIRRQTPFPRDAFFETLGLRPGPRNLIVTFHPATVEDETQAHCAELIAALDRLDPSTGIIITGSNADSGGRLIDAMMTDFASRRPNTIFRTSFGQALYYSALTYADAVIGNSSSGLYEAPSFKLPTINIGTRQDGRLKAASVIDCEPERHAIGEAIAKAQRLDCKHVINPYGDGHTGARIARHIAAIPDMKALIRKRFRDLPAA